MRCCLSLKALLVGGALLGTAFAGANSLGLGVYLDRTPTNQEINANYTGAKHEPKVGCYLGAFIDLDSTLKQTFTDQTQKVRKMPEEFEAIVKKPHASYFFYMGWGRPIAVDWITYLGMTGKIVHIALEPNNGLSEVKDDWYLKHLADDLKKTEAKIFLRFASEMNGPWVKYSGNPKLYREKFRLVSQIMKKRAPNVAMVWCPYTTPRGPIDSYYPGDEYVDWVGVNMYSVTYFNQDRSQPAAHIHPIEMLEPIYNKYSKRKPIMIGEFGATHYSSLEKKSQVAFAQRAITSLYSALPRVFPRVKSIYYFNGNNLELAHRLNNNYAVTQNASVLQTYREAIASPYFLSSNTGRIAKLEGIGNFSMEPVDGSSLPEFENVLPNRPMAVNTGDVLQGVASLSVWMKHHTGGLKVKVTLGDQVVHTATTKSGWSFTIDTKKFGNGSHLLVVEVFSGSKKLDVQKLRVKILN